MNNDISAMLSQHQRDALLAYYIGQYAPNCGDQYLKNNITSAEDVYEYLLLDPLVTNEVPTSRVASGISSIQQYINSMVMNVEHNVNTSKLDAERVAIWDNGASQYNIWAGEVELDTYPENYIDPTLRQDQTEYFKELTTDLNQNALSNTTAQQAVMNYLSKFEQVANLDIISGYFDGTDQLSSVYYLLGQTKTSPYKYYWRSFDMKKNINNTVLTDAWSEWKPINVAFNEEALVGTVRPVFLNNRLYLFWFEMIKDGQTTEKEESSTYQLNAWSACYDLSGKWSAPMLLASIDQTTQTGHIDALLKKLNSGMNPSTLVANCVPGGNESPFINVSLFIADSSITDGYDYFSVKLDYWMNVVKIGNNDLLPVYKKFDGNNQQVVQHVLPLDGNYVITCKPLATQDCNGLLSVIGNMGTDSITVNKETGKLEKVSMKFDFDRSYNMGISGEDSYGSVANYDFEYPDVGTQYFSLWGESNHTIPILGNTIHAKLQYEHRNGKSHLNNSSRFQLRLDSTGTGSASLFEAKVPASLSAFSEVFDFKCSGLTPRKYYVDEPFLLNMRPGFTTQTSVNYNTNAKAVYYNASLYAFNGDWLTGSKIKSYGPSNNLAPMKLDCTESNFSFKNSSVMTYTYGIYIDDSHSAWRSYSFTGVKYSDLSAPTIKTGVNTAEGSATYLDFGAATFPGSIGVKSVRLNTLFAKELINKASISIASLLDWKTQFTLEPPLSQSGGAAVPMDFSGANGIYFWELFFHMPHLVAWRLNEEGNYDDAQRWMHYIFNPAAQGRVSDSSTIPVPPDYWSVRPLVEQPAAEAQGIALQLTTDVDALAKADPQHYQKTIFMAYLRNLIAAGDASYRQYTNDGLSLARLYYHQVSTLLGPRPDTRIVQHWQPDMLSSIEVQAREALTLRQHERSLSEDALLLGGSVNGAMGFDGDIFMAPLNTQLIGYWDTIDARVYNLHHNLTLEGLPMSVPLFAQPVNPTLLLEQSMQSGSLTMAINRITSSLPPYRFRTMLQNVKEAAGTLAQMGQTLLSYCERKDVAALQEMDTQQLFNLSDFTLALEQSAIDALNAERAALQASRTSAINRYSHYNQMITRGVTGGEASAMALQTSAGILAVSAAPFYAAGMAMKTIPNIFGFSCGGQDVGAPIIGAGVALQMSSELIANSAQQIMISEGYKRRSEEWEIQRQQADDELNVIDRQLDALAIRQQAASTSLKLAQAQQTNLRNTLNFLTSRFTRADLYSWLCGQLSALYYQAYDAVLALCMTTEACWQYEMGDVTTRFIQTNAWNDSYRGLLVGETLLLNLQQMESAWLNRNTRRLELTKTVSLKSLMANENAWSQFISSGKVDFSLSESLYDDDYPGHYLRQIKALTVTLPALIAPYQDVCMMLTQTGSSVLLKADVEGVKYLADPKKGSSAYVLKNPRASQEIAVSSGFNDAGVFELNFGDERYLPFEGTGAVSNWQIMFPNATSAKQKALLQSLNDVIIQVHYTAMNGGENFAHSVTQL